jgi:dipeptidase E
MPGYSAGPCVLSPSLRGLEAVDDAGAVSRIYGAKPIWEGLALLDEAFVPHFQSPGHPETAAIGLIAERYRAGKIPHRTLRDGSNPFLALPTNRAAKPGVHRSGYGPP